MPLNHSNDSMADFHTLKTYTPAKKFRRGIHTSRAPVLQKDWSPISLSSDKLNDRKLISFKIYLSYRQKGLFRLNSL